MSRAASEGVPGTRSGRERVLVLGDSHGNLAYIASAARLARHAGCDGIVQLGDFGFWPEPTNWPHEKPSKLNHDWLDAVASVLERSGVWMRVLDGNHDAHQMARDEFPTRSHGIRPVRDRVLDWADRGAVWEWSGVRFGALGGGVSIDVQFRLEGVSWWPTEFITDDETGTLAGNAGPSGVDVLFTHDAPVLPSGIAPIDDPLLEARCAHSIRQVASAVERVKPQLVVHGHYHLRWSSTIECSGGEVRVEGLASDIEAGDRDQSWVILEVGDLATHNEVTR